VALPIGSIASSIATPVARPAAGATANATPAASGSFGDSLSKLVNSVETYDQAANSAVQGMLDGTGDVHDAMIALQRAELTLQLTVQMRNKLVQAYQDIMRMPV
jgi:flagellar hook-basal body complex protein FliE